MRFIALVLVAAGVYGLFLAIRSAVLNPEGRSIASELATNPLLAFVSVVFVALGVTLWHGASEP